VFSAEGDRHPSKSLKLSNKPTYQEAQATRAVLLKLLENLAADEHQWASKGAGKPV
jgi:hypothetical protein